MSRKEESIDQLASIIEEVLKLIYGKKMGFALFMFPFGTAEAGDYVCNAKRKDMIKSIRETADRLEKNEEVIGRTIGEA